MSQALSSQRSWIARIAVLGMLASLLAFGAAPAGAAIDTSDSCPTSIPDAGFTDLAGVPAAAVDAINCIADYGISTGTTATTFDPFADVARWQMALFITRQATAHGLGSALPAGTDQGFTDLGGVPAAAVTAINQIAELDISTGTSATTFDPFATVERWQMALFLQRLIVIAVGDNVPAVTLPDGSDQGFTDLAGVPAAAVTAINVIAQLDVADGTTATTFDPFAAVQRWAMALFLARTLAADGITPPPDTTQDFNADKSGRQIVQYDTDGATGERTTRIVYSDLADGDYHVSLFQNVDGDEGEIETVMQVGNSFVFRDNSDADPVAPFDGRADYECTSYNGAEIVSINGFGVGTQCDYDVSPIDGVLDIVLVNSSYNSDVVWLVVWADSDNDDYLDLRADNTPSEDYGVVGPIIWHAGEAPTGNSDLNGEYILYVDHAEQWFVSGDEFMYKWDSNDAFNYDEEFNITFADFNAWFNANDYLYNEDVDGDFFEYNRNPGATNHFSLYDEGANRPTGLTATVGDFDSSSSDTSANDVRLSWSHNPAYGNMEEDANGDAGYCWYRWDADDVPGGIVDSDCWTWDDNSSTSDAAINNRTGVVTDVPAGDWLFTVTAYTADNYESDDSEPSAEVTTAVASGSPKSTSTSTGDTDLSGTVNSGDVLTVNFDQDMDATPPGAESITLKDADGTTCSLTDLVNATFAYPDADTITVTLTAAPACTAAGSTGGLQYPAEVTSSTNIVDDDQGLGWNLTDSADKLFD